MLHNFGKLIQEITGKIEENANNFYKWKEMCS